MHTHVRLQHQSRYQFSEAVKLGPHILRLRPSPSVWPSIAHYCLDVSTETPSQKRFLHEQADALGNQVVRLVVPDHVAKLQVDVDLELDLAPQNPFDFFVDPAVERYPFDVHAYEELKIYREVTEPTGELSEYAQSFSNRPSTVDFLVALNQQMCEDIEYQSREAPGVQSCLETLRTRTGSCRDMAWLQIQVLRWLGFAARFVAGYLIQLKPQTNGSASTTSEAHTADLESDWIEEDNAEYHAWTEVYLPGAGWIGMDPTSGYFTSEGHIPLAFGAFPSQAAPISGTHSLAPVEFDTKISLARLGVLDDAHVPGLERRPAATSRGQSGVIVRSPGFTRKTAW